MSTKIVTAMLVIKVATEKAMSHIRLRPLM
jgi:hypothetical protein